VANRAASFLLGLFFDFEVGGEIFLRNIGYLSMDYRASYSTIFLLPRLILFLISLVLEILLYR
jgi:hypothetical protein